MADTQPCCMLRMIVIGPMMDALSTNDLNALRASLRDPNHAELGWGLRGVKELAETRQGQDVSVLLQQFLHPLLDEDDAREALMQMCLLGQLRAVEMLLEHGVSAELLAADPYRHSGLMHAAAAGHVDIMELLVQRGTRIDAANARGENALLWAAQNRNFPSMQWLLEQGADPTACDNFKMNALTSLVLAPNANADDVPLLWEVAQYLVSAGVPVDAMAREKMEQFSPTRGWADRLEAVQRARAQQINLNDATAPASAPPTASRL